MVGCETSYFIKETGMQWEYTAKWQTDKPYKAMEMGFICPPVVHLGYRSI